jgi:hypothetical protein
MAKKKGKAAAPHAGTVGRVATKKEAVRRAVAELGEEAQGEAIRAFVKDKFGIEMSANMVSAYKSTLRARKGRPGRKPKGELAPAAPAPRAGHGEVTLADLRAMRELSVRVGTRRLRELLELLS